MMRGVFFAFYTKITKLFPQCWPGNTKVFNIFSTFDGFPARSALFSALIAHFQHLTGAHHQRVFGRVEFLLCAHYLPAHAAVKSQCPGVGVQHRKHRVLMLRQLLPGEIQHLLADAPAPGALRHKKVLHLPGLVVYADRGIRHILGIVEIADPAFLLFLLQLRQEKAAGWVCYLHTTKDVPDGIVSINHKVGHIEHLFVTEKARGRGIGMKMLDFARKKLSEHEHPVLSVLNTNTRAIALYTRMGWKLTSGTELEFTPEQYPAVVKKCALVWMRYEGSAQK